MIAATTMVRRRAPRLATIAVRLAAAPLTAALLLAAADVRADEAPFAVGRLWRIERDGQPPSHLFGTFHLADPRLMPLPDDVGEILRAADALVLELHPDDRDGIAAHAFLPPGDSIESFVDGATAARLLALARDAGLTEAVARRMRPFLLAMLLSQPEAIRRRHAEHPGIDGALVELARAHAIPILGLETSVEQGAAIVALERGHEAAILTGIIDVRPLRDQRYDALVNAYRQGDILACMNETLAQIASENAGLANDFRRIMIIDRNRRMVERLRRHLAAGNVFVGIGAAHLPGRDGVLDLLARDGYRPRRLDGASARSGGSGHTPSR